MAPKCYLLYPLSLLYFMLFLQDLRAQRKNWQRKRKGQISNWKGMLSNFLLCENFEGICCSIWISGRDREVEYLEMLVDFCGGSILKPLFSQAFTIETEWCAK
mmetsp:Transcript_2011/g.2690  ORF Transcript_2011/g.2690 Transcript_2011/m.2690 type:complete len:103 (-) Transcript_2011:121-429(-)